MVLPKKSLLLHFLQNVSKFHLNQVQEYNFFILLENSNFYLGIKAKIKNLVHCLIPKLNNLKIFLTKFIDFFIFKI